jgi:hypothetical protein
VSWIVAGGVLAALLALVVLLLIVQCLRARKWKHLHDRVITNYHTLRDAYHALRGARPLVADDHELLTALAEELQGCVVTPDGSVLLDDAEAFNIATIPAPCIEIEYADRLVTLTLSVERYTAEEIAEREEAMEVLA